MKNIYYLRNQHDWQTDIIEQARRNNSQLRTLSPSSRKTEPKRSLSVRHRLTQHPNTQPANSNRQTHQQQPCSSIQRNPTIIHFSRVHPNNTQRIKLSNSRKETSKARNEHSKCEARTVAKQEQQSTQSLQQGQQDSLSAFQGLYSLQPMRKLFLCQRCIAYLPVIEIKSHFSHCVAPKTHQQHLDRWTKIALLLQEINQIQPEGQLFKLSALMLAYAQSQRTESSGLLYSQQLSRILACKQGLSTACLNEGQLFEVLERLGDRLETAARPSSWPWCS